MQQTVPFFDLNRDSEAASVNDYLAKKLTFHCLKPEEVLLKKGSPLDRIFVIISGLLQVNRVRSGFSVFSSISCMHYRSERATSRAVTSSSSAQEITAARSVS